MVTTVYRINSKKINKSCRIALVSDLHDRPCRDVVEGLKRQKPDIITVVGDLTSRIDCREGELPPCNGDKLASHAAAFELLTAAAGMAPTYYSLGNHELCGHYYRKNYGRIPLDENLEAIKKTGAVLLDDEYIVEKSGMLIGGLTSGHTAVDLIPKTQWLADFTSKNGFKLLLCHHPEYYEKYLLDKDIDLILSGHAHGGQIRLFGKGLLAHGQGLFPKYTSGVYDGKIVVGRGLANTAGLIPRLFNPCELVIIELNG